MKRIPEPVELMDEKAQAKVYAEADFREPNQLFLNRLLALMGDRAPNHALDLGCGPADITLHVARHWHDCRVDGLDGAEAMLAHGRRLLQRHPATEARVNLICDTLPSALLPQRAYDLIFSNSLLHHLHNPDILWQTIQSTAIPGAAIFIMDLRRPNSPQTVESLVQRYAANEPQILQRDFRASLCAAFTPDEVQQQLNERGLTTLSVHNLSDRHLSISGFLPG
ncbi:class I SAM-dependent methyltransferase [endosymbiont of Ridgeia piscesae]|uniref:Ubiquinone/menaquinone biosynthesis C-methylase UbiE n=1 Tax=endosymbiont of Ridgeia piscesae TaxID=54398 RepID=A0A0T5YTN9_9GAMM|nr:class I SAM-dependent methyltransferase [endosymbiont of Ridgeia piscesae]KRT53956.1 Ubiquinone/menaquinone biosynthesis C-methylase UbiE [endosymbiont of Ridgeia piscesae]KRT59163.1 Ubiquinone/menaquinone biosynthesis C-methylase UbiE [endosymbiont of Ridgeia piscesae]